MRPEGSTVVAREPWVLAWDEFVRGDELDALRAEALRATSETFAVPGSGRDPVSLYAELAVDERPTLRALIERIEETLGLSCCTARFARVRRYAPGESHGPHVDEYELDGAVLAVTALLYLSSHARGGHTQFVRAEPPVAVEARAGRLAVWLDLLEDASPDERSSHASAAADEERCTIAYFIYVRRDEYRRWFRERFAPVFDPQRPAPAARAAPKRVFACVDDGVPSETMRALASAAKRHDLEFHRVQSRTFDFAPERVLAAGSLLYRPAVSFVSQRVEQHLFARGVATFYRGEDGVHFQHAFPTLLFERAGVTIPRTIPLVTADRAALRKIVDRLGGLPIVMKMLGGSGGVGVLKVDSLASLFALADYALAQGQTPMLSAYVADATHWRVVVVGDRAVAAYPNPADADDFRTSAPVDRAAFTTQVHPALEREAVSATRAIGLEFAGVDVMLHASGRAYVLEANFPCYFGHAQGDGAIDVAGAMVAHLLDKARR